MTTSIVKCPHCDYTFNYEFIPSASFYSIRLGTQRIFRCPSCKELHSFNITHFGMDPSLPTHGDNAETSIGAKNIALILGPLIVLVTVGILLLITGIFLSVLVVIIPVVIGIVWLASYIAYIYRKASRENEDKGSEIVVC